jgi:hypothetical protein
MEAAHSQDATRCGCPCGVAIAGGTADADLRVGAATLSQMRAQCRALVLAAE